MRYFFKISTAILILLILLSLVSQSTQTKKVNCRKYVYAPVCRGVAAKRALPKLPHSMRDASDSVILDLDTPVQWRDKDKSLNEKGLLHIMFEKLEPKGADYENDNMENDLD